MSSLANQLEARETFAVKENMQRNSINVTSSVSARKNGKDNSTTTLKKPPPTSTASTSNVVGSASVASSVAESSSAYVKQNPKSLLPTYKSSEESDYYKTAKALLRSGDFETALSTIEDGIAWTKKQLSANSNRRQGLNDDDINSLHESLAPFHYLYGTTLLYSIEESTDGLQPLTTVEGATIAVPDADEEGDANGQEYEGVHASSNYNANGTVPETDEPQGDNVEDMEIAWENLETARTILERMILHQPNSDKLLADMAQILLREGDLQRQNGAYNAAVTDYTSCLSYYERSALIPQFCRKIADVHCNLGAVYFNLVVDTKKGADTQDMNGNVMEIQERDRPAKIIFYRNRGFYHYYECSKTLVGNISEIFQGNPYEIFQLVEKDHLSRYCYCDERSDDYPKSIRAKLTKLRQFVTTLTTTKSVPTVELTIDDTDLIRDSLAILEEIQETIDEAETSEQGVVEAAAMKDEITALVTAQQQYDEGNGMSGATHNGTSTAFGSASAAASTAMAQPINMIVKKKKKRTETLPVIDEEGMDVKLPAKDNNKRIKSNE